MIGKTALSLIATYREALSENCKGASKFRPIILLCTALVCVIALFILAFKVFGSSPSSDRYIEPGRDYSRVPFDELDAHSICKQLTIQRYGESYLRGYIDRHSSRHDLENGLFKVFMFVDIGTLQNYEQAAIHCFVDPNEYVVDHYRTYFPNKESLLEKAKGFFASN